MHSKVACDRLRDAKKVPLKNFAWRKFHPYKVHVTHKTERTGQTPHVNFCRQFLDIVNNEEGVFDILIMLDEVHFHM